MVKWVYKVVIFIFFDIMVYWGYIVFFSEVKNDLLVVIIVLGFFWILCKRSSKDCILSCEFVVWRKLEKFKNCFICIICFMLCVMILKRGGVDILFNV